MRLKRSWVPALAVAFIALVTGGWLLQHSARGSDSPFFKAQLFEQVRRLIAERYVNETDESELYQMAIEGMLRELEDPYTTFLDSAEWEQLQLDTTGNYGGLGIRIGSQDGWITVMSVLPNTPAEREGLQAGDRIVAVEGESAEGWSSDRAVNVLRGPRGSEVNITVARVGMDQPLRFTIERDEVHVVAVQSFMLDDRTGYVKLDPFSRNARRELRQAIDGLRAEGARGLVFDLRENPGGLLDEGVAVSDLFLEEGAEVVTTGGRTRSENETFRAPGPDNYPGLPIVVLVDGYSASASEIVAGALQDHDRALVLGTTTFGKGSVQSLFNLPGQNYLKMTTGKWFTPSGRSIQKPNDRESRVSQLVAQAISMGGSPVQASVDTTERETYRTEGGRVVYGGGGITPDLIVTPDTLTSREQLFHSTLQNAGTNLPSAAFHFAVEWVDAHPDLTPDFAVDGSMREAFYDFLVKEQDEVLNRDLYDDARRVVDRQLGIEVASVAFGELEQQRRHLRVDRQLDEAVHLLRRSGDPEELFAAAEVRQQRFEATAAAAGAGADAEDSGS